MTTLMTPSVTLPNDDNGVVPAIEVGYIVTIHVILIILPATTPGPNCHHPVSESIELWITLESTHDIEARWVR
jgi:hypothetical protein